MEQDVVPHSQPLSGLAVNGKTVNLSLPNALTAINTSTTLIGGPTSDVATLYSSIPGSLSLGSDDPGFYMFCMWHFSSLPTSLIHLCQQLAIQMLP